MIKKKQVIAILSIALMSFLIGTSMVTYGGNPFDKIWEAIYCLQDRVEALEDQMEPLGEVPFNGMTMSYEFHDNYDVQGGEVFTRPITFYGNSSEPDYIWVAGFVGMFSPWRHKISVDTRKIIGEDAYSATLFPTDIQIGDEINTYCTSSASQTFTIIGNQTMSVMGKHVEAWIAYYEPVTTIQYTLYHEKKTGILLCGSFVSCCIDENPVSRSIYLVGTNAPL